MGDLRLGRVFRFIIRLRVTRSCSIMTVRYNHQSIDVIEERKV